MSDFTDAASAGVLARIPCHPLDTIKTVSFAGNYSVIHQHNTTHKSLWAVAREIIRTDGITGLWRGAGIAVAGAAPGNALYLVTYETSKKYLAPPAVEGASSATALQWLLRFGSYMLCGVVAEAAGCILWVPVDVVKERMQSQPAALEGRYRNSFDALSTILRNEGLWGCYRGYLSTLASFGPYSGVYFMSLEGCYEGYHFLRRRSYVPELGTFAESLTCAAMANCIAAFATNPFELVKTRLQLQRTVLTVRGQQVKSTQYAFQYNGMRDGLRRIVREEGVRGLWRGVSARVIYAVPNSSLTMALFKMFKEQREHKNSQ